MFRLHVTIIRQTFQYMDMTCRHFSTWTRHVDFSVHGHDMFSAYSTGSHIVYICCVEFQTFRLINCSIFNILTNVYVEIIYESIKVGIPYCKHWTCYVHVLKCLRHARVLKCLHVMPVYWSVYMSCPCIEMSACHVRALKCLHVMSVYWNVCLMMVTCSWNMLQTLHYWIYCCVLTERHFS
jgi:hypothetical protein